MSTRPATTVLLCRDGAEGLEVFMVQRHRRSGFLPNAWVFPGGRVDDGDRLHGNPRLRGGARLLQQLNLPVETAVAYAVAGVRETFEESGVWLGTGSLPWDLRDPLNDGEVRLVDALDAHDATLELDGLRVWSWWVTPEVERRRYDTRFLIARAPEAPAQHDAREVVNSRWVSPATVVDLTQEAFPMAPPTWWTLTELAQHPDVDSALRAADRRDALRPIQPIMRFDETGVQLMLPGHPEHAEPAIPGVTSEIAFAQGRWVCSPPSP